MESYEKRIIEVQQLIEENELIRIKIVREKDIFKQFRLAEQLLENIELAKEIIAELRLEESQLEDCT